MIQTLLDKLSKCIDERQTISALRQEIKDEDKLNELVDAYNEMAKQLKELYESLETKVKERTIRNRNFICIN